MSVFSAAEDFSCNTLEAVPGLLGKLSYLGSLKGGNGRYQHWGLERKYGESAAQKSMRNAHREIVLRILRTPTRDLLKEVEFAANRDGVSMMDYVSRLAADAEHLMPMGATDACQSHFRIILRSLLSLAQGCRDASLQAS